MNVNEPISIFIEKLATAQWQHHPGTHFKLATYKLHTYKLKLEPTG